MLFVYLDHYNYSLQNLQRSQPAKSMLPHLTLSIAEAFLFSGERR
jgi:hypothetical protein